MTTLRERYPDLMEDGDDPDLAQLIGDLDSMRIAAGAEALPPSRDATIRQALAGRAHRRTAPPPRRLALPALPRTRLASIGVAALLIAGGLTGYFRLQTATPVSAAQILHRAISAMAAPLPGQVVHETVADTSSALVAPPGAPAGSTGTRSITTEQWARLASADSADRLDLSLSENGKLIERQVVNAQGSWSYNADQNTAYTGAPYVVTFSPPSDGIISAKQVLLQPEDPAYFRDLVAVAASSPDLKLLPQQTIDGRAADVIQYSRTNDKLLNDKTAQLPDWAATRLTFTLYIDASSYTVLRLGERDYNAQGAEVAENALQVTKYEVLDTSQVPAGTFTFTPPAGATVGPMPAPPTKTASP